MQKLFGTDGIRGLVGGDLINPTIGYKLGRAIIKYCEENGLPKKIIVGRDTRGSGEHLESSVASGVFSVGGEVVFAGVISSPGLAFLTRNEKMGAGIMLSASHNDYRYNGFKVFSNQGEKLSKEEEQKIEALLLSEADPNDLDFDNIKKELLENSLEKYQEFLLSILLDDFDLGDLKIVLDCANGASSEIVSSLFGKIGNSIVVINNSPDGNNINKNCGSEHPESLSKKVIEEKADLGIAFDGDADRLQIVDENGKTITGDQVLYACAKMLKEQNKLKNNILVCTIMSNQGFVNDLKKIGIEATRTDVGDRNVVMAMKSKNAQIGGEESGHIIFSDYHTTGDGVLSALIFLQAMKYFNKSVSDLAKEVNLLPKILLNIEVNEKPALKSLDEVQNIIKEVEECLGEKGRVSVRYSGTEPKCRVMIEGENDEEIKNLAESIINVIDKNINK